MFAEKTFERHFSVSLPSLLIFALMASPLDARSDTFTKATDKLTN